MAVAVIGGTGLYALADAARAETIATPYGEAQFSRHTVDGQPVIFLARHGATHAVPPHRVNYRANIWALHALGVRDVLATLAVGSLNPHIAPGHFVLPTQFIDWTKGRPATFFDGDDGVVRHVDVTHPFCARLIQALLHAGTGLGHRLHAEVVYACTEGPRFETAAEIHALHVLGADVVGMTCVPEVVLARELGLCYAAVGIIGNWAAGITTAPLTHEEVLEIMAEQAETLRALLLATLAHPRTGDCPCATLGFGSVRP